MMILQLFLCGLIVFVGAFGTYDIMRGTSLTPWRKIEEEPRIPTAIEDWDAEFRERTGLSVWFALPAPINPSRDAFFTYMREEMKREVGAPIRVCARDRYIEYQNIKHGVPQQYWMKRYYAKGL
jgi:hypothetical protein